MGESTPNHDFICSVCPSTDSVETLLLDQVEKLNRQNAELSHGNGVVLDMLRAPVVQPEDLEDLEGEEEEKRRTPEREEEQRAREEEEGDIFGESEEEEGREEQVGEEEVEKRREGGEEESSVSPEPLERYLLEFNPSFDITMTVNCNLCILYTYQNNYLLIT